MKTEAEKDWITKIYEVQAGDILFSESHRRYIAVHSIDADNYIYWECYELTPEWKNVLFSIKLQQYELAQGNYRKSKHLTSTDNRWKMSTCPDGEARPAKVEISKKELKAHCIWDEYWVVYWLVCLLLLSKWIKLSE